MQRIILAAVFILALASPTLADTTHCMMRQDEQAQRLVTMGTDGSRAMSHYEKQFKRWHTDIIRAPQSDKLPRGGQRPSR
jgi:hypothetical protein